MNNRAAVAHFHHSLPTRWSLSKRDKRRLKQTLALVAAIIALLWLLYQMGQYTAATGVDQQNKIHVDGDRKMTIHASPGFQYGFSAGGMGEAKRIARALPPPVSGAPRQVLAPEGAGSDQTATAPLSNRNNQSGVAGTPGANTQQQIAAGPNDSLSFGYGNLPVPSIFNGGGAGSSGNTRDVGSGNSGNNGGGNPGGNGGANSGNNGDSGGPGNGGSNANSGGNGDGSSGNPPSGSTPGPGDNGHGANPGNSPGGDPDVFPNLGSPPFGNGPDASPPGTPFTDSPTNPADNSPNIQAPTIEVPEPGSIALFGAGLLVLLTTLGRQRRLSRSQAPSKEFANVDPHASYGLNARRVAGWTMRRMCLTVVMGVTSLAIVAGAALAETATVYGTTASIFSPNSGAFLPANTTLTCFSMNEANCWDGRKWQHLYPAGRRHYAVATTDRVACSVIMAPSNDCWTGSAWYRLPKGQLFGVIGGFFSNTPGAFITAPLRSPAVTYTATSLQSPLGEFASKR